MTDRPCRGGCVALAVAVAVLATGCASRSGRPFIIGRPSSADATVPKTSLDDYVARLRGLSVRAAGERRRSEVISVESRDPVLGSALRRLAVAPSPESHRRVAAAYRRAGILDLAFDHYRAVARLEPAHPAAWDGMARIWRDWGFAHVGLADAHRAVYLAPGSAEARNTLGTLLQAVGDRRSARREFERAVALNPRAAWAHNNLCYAALADEDHLGGLEACRRAVALDPTLAVARGNLAEAERRLARSGSPAAGEAVPPTSRVVPLAMPPIPSLQARLEAR
jgi:tetratricopeptide (TPR) repeat protein